MESVLRIEEYYSVVASLGGRVSDANTPPSMPAYMNHLKHGLCQQILLKIMLSLFPVTLNASDKEYDQRSKGDEADHNVSTHPRFKDTKEHSVTMILHTRVHFWVRG